MAWAGRMGLGDNRVSSTIPAALDALVAAFTAIGDVQVIDGRPLSIDEDYLAVGFASDPEQAAVTVSDEPSDAGLSQTAESYDVACVASAWDGDSVLKVARDRVFEIFDAAVAAVSADHTLSGAVMRARLSSDGLIQDVAVEGVLAVIPFTVHIDAFA